LHYYEEIGLLKPTARTSSGHRLYGRDAIERLQQIKSLQQLGLSLAEVDALICGQAISPRKIVADHLAEVRAQREALDQLESQLERLARLLEGGETDDRAAVEVFLTTMEAMTMYDKYLDSKQITRINQKHAAADAAAQAAWNAALAALRDELQAGTKPTDPKVRDLVEQWHKAAAAFVPDDDEATHEGLMKVLHEEPKALEQHGLEPELFAYIGRAVDPQSHS